MQVTAVECAEHHRKIGTGQAGALKRWLQQGEKDYCFGNHPLWEIFRTFHQMTQRPFIIGGGFLALGFALANIKRLERPISSELFDFIRREQMTRLKKIVKLN